MSLTTPTLVQALLGPNYGPNPDGTLPDLQQFADSAAILMARVVTCATAKGKSLTDAEKEMVERWLAASFYCRQDPLYSSRSTAGASGAFVNVSANPQIDAEADRYRRGAIELDYSGCLNAILNRKRATLASISCGPRY